MPTALAADEADGIDTNAMLVRALEEDEEEEACQEPSEEDDEALVAKPLRRLGGTSDRTKNMKSLICLHATGALTV